MAAAFNGVSLFFFKFEEKWEEPTEGEAAPLGRR